MLHADFNELNDPNDQRIHALPHQRNNAIDDENNTGCRGKAKFHENCSHYS